MRRLLLLLPVLAALQACSGNDDAPVASANLAMVNGAGGEDDPTATASQIGYAVAFDGSGYLVVWSVARDGTLSDILAARVGPDGARLDAAPIVVSGAAGDQVLPDVAFDGTNYLVVWQDQRAGGDKNIHAARVSPAGVVLDPASIAIAEPGNQLNPEVAFLGTSFLVVWEDTRNTLSDIYAARVTLDGARGPAFPLSTAAGHQVQPAVGCGLDTCLATWRDGRNGGPDVYGARITADGVVDLDGLAISRASSSQGTPAVASDGTDFLVAWSDTRNGTSDVYGARVGRDGVVLDPTGLAIARAPDAQQATAAAFEGANYLVAWEDRRSGTGFEVYGARVSPAGALLDPDGFRIESGTAGTRVALDSNRAGRALVASDGLQVLDPLLGTSIARLRTRIVTTRAILTVSRVGNGSGTVTSAPAGIDCGEICSSFFDAPTDVALTPVPAAGSAFVSWSGACTGAGPCTVTVDDARSVTAKFSPYHLLTVTRSGSAGAVVSTPAGIDCGSACAAEFVEETLVELKPVPGANSLFGSWEGPCAPTVQLWDPLNPASCRVRIAEAATVSATFRAAYPVTVNATGTASGRVDASGWPIHCATGSSAGCSSLVFSGDTVTLTATPAEGAILKSWIGCSTSSGNTCTVSVYSAAKTVTATFQPAFYPLTLASTGGGGGAMAGEGMACDVSSTARCTFNVANGGSATVTVTPNAASIFKSWSNCTSVTGTSCTVTMIGPRTITANVQPSTFVLTAVAGGTGKGTVTGPGISCASGSSAGCSAAIANGELVTLEATPDAQSIVKYWTGCYSSSGSTCTVSMTAAKSVTAVFQPSHYLLTVSPTGGGGGTIFSEGFTCTALSGVPCTTLVPNGATVTYTASPDTSSIFKSWSGCSSTAGDTCTVSMSGARTITANIQPSTYLLTIAPTGSGTVQGAGLVCTEATPELCAGPVANGETATLEALPAAGWILKSWSGCTSSSGTTCTVAMTAAKKVTATFQPATYLLTALTSGTGGGTVTGPGIACASGSSAGCSAPVANGDTVTLTAAADGASVFKGWMGCTSSSGTSCTVSMTMAKTVTATFQPAFYALTMTFSGGGGGTVASDDGAVSCGSGGAPCTVNVANGATLTLTATPDGASLFKYWTGCSSSSGTTCTISMTMTRTVTAVVQPSTYALAVLATGTANGTVEGPGISCATGSSAGCTAPIANGATVTLTAVPAEGAILKSWSGCSAYSGTTCTVSMTMAKSVTATFQPAFYPLTLASSGGGGGTIASEDGAVSCVTGPTATCTTSVANGGSLTLTATPDAQSVFKYWTGCTSSSGATCNVTMTGARTATAVFQPSAYLLTAVTSGASGRIDGGPIACATGSSAGCSAMVDNGATVTLVATPASDALFKSWSGCSSVSGTTCVVTMSAAKTVTATFQPATYLLTTTATGSAAGTIEGPGILCATGSSSGCAAQVANGETVTLTAVPAAGAILKSWSGCGSYSGTSCTVSMTMARNVTATFQPSTYLLAVSFSGTGTGSVTGPGISCTTGSADGCSAEIANGDTVTLTAVPDEGTLFRGWSGCSIVSGTTCTLTMTGARTVLALY